MDRQLRGIPTTDQAPLRQQQPESPGRALRAQDPRPHQQRLPARQEAQSDTGMRGEARRDRASGAVGRTDAPRNPADRAYMGGGMILENGRPVPLPGDPPGFASDFRGGRAGQPGADQGMAGSPQGVFPANPPIPGGRIPTRN
jgi:hypothetical protein